MSFVFFLLNPEGVYYYYHLHFVCDGTKNGEVKQLAPVFRGSSDADAPVPEPVSQ